MKTTNNSDNKEIEGAKITAKATIIGAVIGVVSTILAGFIGIIPTMQSNTYSQLNDSYKSMQLDYENLQSDYETLKETYDELLEETTKDKYWAEYTVEEDEVIADKASDCSIVFTNISLYSVSLSIRTGSDEVQVYSMSLNDQVNIDEEGRYSLLVTAFDYNKPCTFIIKEN